MASLLLASVWLVWRDPRNSLFLARSRLLSKIVGGLTNITVPHFLRNTFYSKFAAFYEINMKEIKLELSEFRSFRDFFIRELKDGSRP